MDKAIDALQSLQSAFEDADLDDIVSRIEKLEAENDELRARNLATPENAATQLLEEYTSNKPSAGEVGRLKERISEILVSEFGINTGVLP